MGGLEDSRSDIGWNPASNSEEGRVSSLRKCREGRVPLN